jgi:hypothetical protein
MAMADPNKRLAEIFTRTVREIAELERETGANFVFSRCVDMFEAYLERETFPDAVLKTDVLIPAE